MNTDARHETGRDEKGRFAPSNKIWEARISPGISPKFKTADDLKAGCVEYFQWSTENPLISKEKVTYQGQGGTFDVPKMRAMTIVGLCNFLGITTTTWYGWKGELKDQPRMLRSDLLGIIEWAEGVIYQSKFEGAAADLLNANIISRDLGMADRRELTGKDGGPIETNGNRTPIHEDMEAYQLAYYDLLLKAEKPFYVEYLNELARLKHEGRAESSVDVSEVMRRALDALKELPARFTEVP